MLNMRSITVRLQLISLLQCSLVGRELDNNMSPESRAAEAYVCSIAKERYYCNFGVNPAFAQILRGEGMHCVAESAAPSRLLVTGCDSEGEVRVLEAPSPHPFFVGTLFVPQALSTPERPHPLVSAFLRTAAAAAAASA
jgi:CTP synthase (UTP-ammonia lyase)